MLECIVTKFGGSSLASDEQFRKVRSILELEPTRLYLIPSAPGKRFPTDEKVTDLLYACYALASEGKSFEDLFVKIRERYLSIAQHLHLEVDIEVLKNMFAQDGLLDEDSPMKNGQTAQRAQAAGGQAQAQQQQQQ